MESEITASAVQAPPNELFQGTEEKSGINTEHGNGPVKQAEKSATSSDCSFMSSSENVENDTSATSNITSVTQSSDQYVHCKLYKNITELRSVFIDVTNTMQDTIKNKNIVSNENENNVVLLTDEQIQKCMKTLNKTPVMEMFTKLYSTVRPICLASYTPDNRPKASSQDIQISSMVEKVNEQF